MIMQLAVSEGSLDGRDQGTAAFRETIYENVWQSHADLWSLQRSIALDKLGQLAVKGLGQTPTREKGEGAYMSLPLNGRINLMSRPQS